MTANPGLGRAAWVAAIGIALLGGLSPLTAQDLAGDVSAGTELAEQKANEALTPPPTDDNRDKAQSTKPALPEIDLLELYFRGGVLMYPITFISFIVLAFAIERALALRRRRIVPPKLVEHLRQLAASSGGLDPRRAYRLCQDYPSSAATVIKAMLMKIGRPHAEVEHAVSEASDREATRLYTNVRPIALAVTIEPLLGLLGTVQGMIMAFFVTANAPAGVNKAQSLADGIYTALVTTFAGLAVAIPAAILAHYFEGRIMALFRDIDDVVQSLLPQVERFEGKMRVGPQQASAAKNEPQPPAGAIVRE